VEAMIEHFLELMPKRLIQIEGNYSMAWDVLINWADPETGRDNCIRLDSMVNKNPCHIYGDDSAQYEAIIFTWENIVKAKNEKPQSLD
jgi:hypothetical protein